VTISKGNRDLLTEQPYPLILADPPWKYEFSSNDNRKIENHYPTMDLETICKLPIQKVSMDDCILFLWATSPKLQEAMQVMEAWGFDYKSSMVWVKDKIGMGYYARQRHEFLLIGLKGQIPAPAPEARVDSVVESPRQEHSQKPAKFYEIIEGMYPDLPKLELFARNKREGWESWGNQDDQKSA